MGRRPWYPFYVDDFEQDETVKLLNNRETGAYLRLLNSHWREGSLPPDVVSLAKLAGERPREFAKMWAKIGHKFPENGDGRRRNKRMQVEIENADEVTKQASEAARIRWQRKRKHD